MKTIPIPYLRPSVYSSARSQTIAERVLQLIEQLEIPELCYEERLEIASQLRDLFGAVQELEPASVI